MNITNQASNMILEDLKNNECTAIRLSLQNSCCGTSLSIDLIEAKDETPVVINSVPVVMDAETAQWCEDITLDMDGDQMTILRQGGCSCGCRGGCC